jgi:hypothetical protein
VLRNLVDTKGKQSPLASTNAARGTLKPVRGAHIKWVIRTDLKSVLGSAVPYQAWTSPLRGEELSGPACHARPRLPVAHDQPCAAGAHATDCAPSFTVTSMADDNGARHPRDVQVPLFLGDTTQYSKMHTDSAGNPAINGAHVDRELHLRPTVNRADGGRRRRPSTGTGARQRGRGRRRLVRGRRRARSDGCATDWSASRTTTLATSRNLHDLSTFATQVDHMLQGFVNSSSSAASSTPIRGS